MGAQRPSPPPPQYHSHCSPHKKFPLPQLHPPFSLAQHRSSAGLREHFLLCCCLLTSCPSHGLILVPVRSLYITAMLGLGTQVRDGMRYMVTLYAISGTSSASMGSTCPVSGLLQWMNTSDSQSS